MSPSWGRKRVCISFGPAAVRAAGHEAPAQPAAPGAVPWQAALETLQATLGAWRELRGDASIVLSSAFVRYAVVAHAGRVSGRHERAALARAQFEKIHGERAAQWAVRLGGDGLAAAVDAALVEALKALFERTPRLRLVSIQPALMAAYNAARGRIPEVGAWLVLAEEERVCIGLLEGPAWRGVSVARDPQPTPARCGALLERERVRMAPAQSDVPVLYLAATGQA